MAEEARMKVEEVPLDELRPASYNPRKRMSGRERRALESSLEKYGMVQPIVVNRSTGRVVGGHQRLSVLKEIGAETAPVLYVEMNEEQEKRANVALNSLGADWDVEKLQELLGPMSVEEVQELGWSKVESEALLAGLFLNADTKRAMLEEMKAAAGAGEREEDDGWDDEREEPKEKQVFVCPKCGYRAPRHEFIGGAR